MNALQFGEAIYLSEAELFEHEISKISGLSPKFADSVFHIEREDTGEYGVTRFPIDLPPRDQEDIWPQKRVETLKLNKSGVSQRIDILDKKFFTEYIGTVDHISSYLIRDLTDSPPSSL